LPRIAATEGYSDGCVCHTASLNADSGAEASTAVVKCPRSEDCAAKARGKEHTPPPRSDNKVGSKGAAVPKPFRITERAVRVLAQFLKQVQKNAENQISDRLQTAE